MKNFINLILAAIILIAQPRIFIEEVDNNDYFDASYVYADIYLKDIHELKAYMGKGTMSTLAHETDALFAINGIFWNHNNQNKYIVYNGELIKELDIPSERDYWIIYDDGSMVVIPQSDNNFPTSGVWQVWSFGPGLVHNGEKITSYPDIYYPKLASYAHPRMAIGYFEPNHFCFLMVNGRNVKDHGAYLEEMAQFFYDKGCVEAYNLDGGGSSHMWYNGKEYGHPCEDRVLSDIFYIKAK